MSDCISREAAKDKLVRLINEMEEIFSDIREKNCDDSVCGLCEYDSDHGLDGFANECPGFERDDCFKLKDEYRKEWLDLSVLPSVTPTAEWVPMSERLPQEEQEILVTINSPGRKRKVVRSGYYDENLFILDNGDVWDKTDEEVMAWMPKPKPWEGEE